MNHRQAYASLRHCESYFAPFFSESVLDTIKLDIATRYSLSVLGEFSLSLVPFLSIILQLQLDLIC